MSIEQVDDGDTGLEARTKINTVIGQLNVDLSSSFVGGAESVTILRAENHYFLANITRQTPAFSIVGGADAAWFYIDPITGKLYSQASLREDSPIDADNDNNYEITVQIARDGVVTTQNITIRIRRPLLSFDFTNDFYWVAGVKHALADILSAPTLVQPGRGLIVPPNLLIPEYIGDAVTAFAATEYSFVVDLDDTAMQFGGPHSFFAQAAADQFTHTDISSGQIFTLAQGNGVSTRQVFCILGSASARARIAGTITDSGLALSVNGSAVATDATPGFVIPAPTHVTISNSGSGTTNSVQLTIRSFELYEPQSNADLPSFSTLQ